MNLKLHQLSYLIMIFQNCFSDSLAVFAYHRRVLRFIKFWSTGQRQFLVQVRIRIFNSRQFRRFPGPRQGLVGRLDLRTSVKTHRTTISQGNIHVFPLSQFCWTGLTYFDISLYVARHKTVRMEQLVCRN